jgi:hypothetical protein
MISHPNLLSRYHRMLDTPFDPQKNGFVLTNDQIAVHMQLENLKSRALEAERMDFNRGAYSKRYGTAVAQGLETARKGEQKTDLGRFGQICGSGAKGHGETAGFWGARADFGLRVAGHAISFLAVK